MKIDELITVRRSSHVGFSRMYNEPLLNVSAPSGRIVISKTAAVALDINENEGLMFGFNYKEQKAYVFKENEPDSFRCRRPGNNSFRFTSKNLLYHFSKCFELNFETNPTHHFSIATIPDSQEAYQLNVLK
jgi:hypothetical protein